MAQLLSLRSLRIHKIWGGYTLFKKEKKIIVLRIPKIGGEPESTTGVLADRIRMESSERLGCLGGMH